MPDTPTPSKGQQFARVPMWLMKTTHYQRLGPAAKDVLIAILGQCPAHSFKSWPVSYRRIAELACCTQRTAERAVDSMVNSGLLIKHQRAGRAKENAYTLAERDAIIVVESGDQQNECAARNPLDGTATDGHVGAPPTPTPERHRHPRQSVSDTRDGASPTPSSDHSESSENKSNQPDPNRLAAELVRMGVSAAPTLLAQGVLDGLTMADLHAIRERAMRATTADPNGLTVHMLRTGVRPPPTPRLPTADEALELAQRQAAENQRELEAERSKAATPEQRLAAIARGRERAKARTAKRAQNDYASTEPVELQPPREPTELELAQHRAQLEKIRDAVTPAARGVA